MGSLLADVKLPLPDSKVHTDKASILWVTCARTRLLAQNEISDKLFSFLWSFEGVLCKGTRWQQYTCFQVGEEARSRPEMLLEQIY